MLRSCCIGHFLFMRTVERITSQHSCHHNPCKATLSCLKTQETKMITLVCDAGLPDPHHLSLSLCKLRHLHLNLKIQVRPWYLWGIHYHSHQRYWKSQISKPTIFCPISVHWRAFWSTCPLVTSVVFRMPFGAKAILVSLKKQEGHFYVLKSIVKLR